MFIALTGNEPHIDGLVLVDANHETQLQVLSPDDANLAAMGALMPTLVVALRRSHELTREE